MQCLELLAPARNKEIGIAAIDCGADAVYIAGPDFGARKAAGNSFGDIAELCDYAHRYGVRVFVTYNTLWRAGEEAEAHAQMLRAQEAGADAFIIREPRIAAWDDIAVPLHASTQCAIRTVEQARYFASLGCERIILERELPLETIRQICAAVAPCEVEFFVHGALCVCYSGECRLSEYIDGRSADRGECIQACRSRYDLADGSGRVLVRDKALLSLRDYNLKARLEELADAGVSSFKIEGRLKNASYVKNVVRDYSLALDALVEKYPERYRRASFGVVEGGFTPDTAKTFNRGYTELYLDGRRGKWASLDAPKSMGEAVGTVENLRRSPGGPMQFRVRPRQRSLALRNGDGFAFTAADGIVGFRGDVCEGLTVRCKDVPELREGMTLYRNVDAAFEKELEARPCRRMIPVRLSVRIHGDYVVEVRAVSQDGRELCCPFHADVETAENGERAAAMLREQLSKRSGHYRFSVEELRVESPGGRLPLLSASTINGIRRLVAEDLEDSRPPTGRPDPKSRPRAAAPDPGIREAKPEMRGAAVLMRSKYCIRYELDLCPKYQGGRPPQELFLLNNGRRFALHFDCAACEMTLTPAQK